jgi:hypothetical protein
MCYTSTKSKEDAMNADSGPVTVYRSQGMLAAHVVKGKLDAAGVPAILRYESLGIIYGLTVDGLGLVEVQVPAAWVEDALALIAEDPAQPGEPDWPADLSDEI